MSTDLSPENENYVQQSIAQGAFHSRSEALDAAVDLLKRRDELSREINNGIEELERGEGRLLDLDLVKANIRKRGEESSLRA